MASIWQWQRVSDADGLEQEPPKMTPLDAQQWCNFIIWIPESNDTYVIESATVRKEAPPGRIEGVTSGRTPWTPNNPAAYRYEVAFPGGRIRVKEFLYDWAFPATDHPSLWRSKAKAVQLNNEYVMWLGNNYYGQQAASARLARTMIEVAVLEGEANQSELLAFFQSLRPVSETAVQSIIATPFSTLSYWARYKAELVGVPTGLWVFQREAGPSEEVWAKDVTGELKHFGLPTSLGDFVAEDLATFTNVQGYTETEICYVIGADRGHELRLVVQKRGKGRIVIPPVPEPHPHDSQVLTVSGVKVYLAWEDKRHGSFDAVWHDNKRDQEMKLISTTGTHMGYEWFVKMLELLIQR